MAKLSGRERAKLPSSEFGEPAKRAYPMPDKSHAANAKARASEAAAKGRISPAEKVRIDAKADAKLRKGR